MVEARWRDGKVMMCGGGAWVEGPGGGGAARCVGLEGWRGRARVTRREACVRV